MKLVVNYKKLINSALLLTLFCSTVFASPTINEFDRCKKISVVMLEGCLKVKTYNDNKSCWASSQSSYKKCYYEVFKGHSRDNKLEKSRKREAIKKHREMLKNKKVTD